MEEQVEVLELDSVEPVEVLSYTDETEQSQALNALADRIHQTAVDHGFWEDDRNFGEMIALAHSELSEALECHRDGEDPVWFDKEKDGKPEGVMIELADCIIRCLDTMASLECDYTPGEAILLKMNYNEGRPYKHGKAY